MATRTDRTLKEILDALAANPQESDVAAVIGVSGAIATALALGATDGKERAALQDALSTFRELIDIGTADATAATKTVAAAGRATEAGRAMAMRASDSDALRLSIGLMGVGVASQGALFVADAGIAAEPDGTRRADLEEALRAAFAPIRQAGHATAPPLQHLAARAFARVVSPPSETDVRKHRAAGVARMLAQLDLPEAREALQALARSADPQIAEEARRALASPAA
jgi:hypothetical protein